MPDSKPLYPLLLQPSLHVKVWGGRKLDTVLGKKLPTEEPYGEAWELHDTSTIINGFFAGQTLADVLATYGEAILGGGNDPSEGMPLLAKLLDASDWLSIQVHPNDAQARELEGDPRGKTEAWIILAAEPGARLVIGVEPGTSREAMAQAIKDNTLEAMIVYADVKAGDVLYIPANTIHAIGPGILLYEIQQSSNVTYRLYDWGRMGLDGNPRDLHIDKGVQVSNIETLPEITHPEGAGETVVMVAGDYFRTVRHTLGMSDALQIATVGQFQALTCIEGSAAVTANEESITLNTGQTALIPADVDHFTLSGQGYILRSFQNA